MPRACATLVFTPRQRPQAWLRCATRTFARARTMANPQDRLQVGRRVRLTAQTYALAAVQGITGTRLTNGAWTVPRVAASSGLQMRMDTESLPVRVILGTTHLVRRDLTTMSSPRVLPTVATALAQRAWRRATELRMLLAQVVSCPRTTSAVPPACPHLRTPLLLLCTQCIVVSWRS